MYSIVLMAALATGVDTPDFGRRGGCCGCYGGYAWGGCYGGCWGGCYGGCYGGGGWGGGWGGGYGGGYGGYALGSWGGWGGWGGWGYGGYAYTPVVASYASPVLVSNVLPATTTATRSMYPNASASNRATIIVHLPADAALMVDGKATLSTSDTRRFVSPPLEAGKEFHYVFEAKVQRDGKIQPISRRVNVRAGERQEISLMPDRTPPPESKRTPAVRKALADRRAPAK